METSKPIKYCKSWSEFSFCQNILNRYMPIKLKSLNKFKGYKEQCTIRNQPQMMLCFSLHRDKTRKRIKILATTIKNIILSSDMQCEN